jgi:hypothetical protein
MEENQSSSLFEMQMDSQSQSHLLSISKWTRFISVTGFVAGGLMLLLIVAVGERMLDALTALTSLGQQNVAGAILAIVVIVFVLLAAWLFFLFKASSFLKKGLQSRNNNELAEGFKALKNYFTLSALISVLSILGTLFGMINR